MSINPLALVFWIICGIAGYLIGDFRGALIGLLCSMSFSLLVGAFSK